MAMTFNAPILGCKDTRETLPNTFTIFKDYLRAFRKFLFTLLESDETLRGLHAYRR